MSVDTSLQGKRVVVVGWAKSGIAAARLALAKGAAEVIGVDAKTDVAGIDGVRMELGPHRRETFLSADVLVVSPGVPAAQPDVAAAIAAGVDVVGELGFASRSITAPIVAITGTNGKSTVTACTGILLAADGRRVFVGGNLGTALSDAALHPDPWDAVVVEVSSYQLELPGTFSARVAAILNLQPDHLARHRTMESYAEHKARIFDRMPPDGVGLLPVTGAPGDAILARAAAAHPGGRRGFLGALPGVVREGRRAHVELFGIVADLDLTPVRLQGDHNLDHAATSATLALAAGAPVDAVQAALGSLVPLPHRMQPVHEAGGVVWIDDSKATNVDATEVAIQGLDRAAVVLLGGQAKGPGFAPLAPHLGRHRAVITFGGDGPMIAGELEACGVTPIRVGTLEEAVARARSLARPGDAVLLSPACASFDAFRNFEHRGDVFAALARGEA